MYSGGGGRYASQPRPVQVNTTNTSGPTFSSGQLDPSLYEDHPNLDALQIRDSNIESSYEQ
jgi:hypothetical protein